MEVKSTFRNHMLDIIKGVCILFVIITHYDWQESERSSLLFPFWIDMAVPVFMVISGYANAASYKQNQIQCLADIYSFRFLIKKLLRFTIPFSIIYILEVFIEICMEGNLLFNGSFSYINIFTCFLSGGWGPGSYYYPIMIQFVFVFPIVYFVIKRNHTLGFVFCLLANAIFEILQYSYGMNESFYRLLLFRYLMLIAFGCFLYQNREKIFRLSGGIVSLAIGASFIILFVYKNHPPVFITYWTSTCWIAGLYVLPILTMLIKLDFRCTVLEMLGRASYNIFLVQMVYYKFYASNIYEKIERRRYELLASIVICIVIGLVFYWGESFFTKKIIKRLERFSIKKDNSISDWLDRQLFKS